MNLKLAIALIALSLPLAGCGNKGPLVLPSKPVPVEADLLQAEPPADAASTDDATAPPPAADALDPATDLATPPPDPATDEPATEPVPPTPPTNDGGNG
ncbi:lipoprotein [Lysobacter koreensis]|uniref:Lipoprotein n=1 Tax=Lysobacter koreensis TaxID=266122 RepID=A0ABW2YPT8_9GAMM